MKSIKIVLPSALIFALAVFLVSSPAHASGQCSVYNFEGTNTLSIGMTRDRYVAPEEPAARIAVDIERASAVLSYNVELYRDNQLILQKEYDNVAMNSPHNIFTLADALGGGDKIPTRAGNYGLKIQQIWGGAVPCAVNFKITFGNPGAATLSSLDISPAVYVLGDTVAGSATVVNSASLAVLDSFSVELYKGPILFWQREIDEVSIPAGTNVYTLDDVFGFKPTIPRQPQFLGEWSLKIANLSGNRESVSQGFTIMAPAATERPPAAGWASKIAEIINKGLDILRGALPNANVAKTIDATAACKPTRGAPESGVFGIVQGFFPWNSDPKMLDYMKELGVKWARLELPWDQIEPQKGQFNWQFYDQIVKLFDENNIQILGQFGNAPCWANSRPCPFQDPLEHNYPPTNLDDWSNFVKMAVARYGPGGAVTLKNPITHWEIWNEPNTELFWRPASNAQEYANLLAVSNKAIREIDPRAVILGGAFAGTPADFADEMYRLGAKNCFDVISLHPYGPVEELKSKIEAIKKFLSDHQDANKPIWYTEYGFITGQPGEQGSVGPKVSEEQQAQYVKQTYELFSQGVFPAMFWISLKDMGTPTAPEETFGLLRLDYSKKPAFDVLKNLLSSSLPSPFNFNR